jgi:hypothetical protein
MPNSLGGASGLECSSPSLFSTVYLLFGRRANLNVVVHDANGECIDADARTIEPMSVTQGKTPVMPRTSHAVILHVTFC